MKLKTIIGGLTSNNNELIEGNNLDLQTFVSFSSILNETNGSIIIWFEWIIVDLESNLVVLRKNEMPQLKTHNNKNSILVKKSIPPSEFSNFILGHTYGIRCLVSLIGFGTGGLSVEKFYDSPRLMSTDLSFFKFLKGKA